MPQMGESVTEGTILGWLKQVGDRVEADEPLVEISTDKVDAEIPAPVSGTLVNIAAAADETVEVGSVLGEIEPDGDGAAPAAPEQEPPAGGGEVVDVAFPEMGDSVAEGTILEWRVKPGDAVAVDDPLVEISTDKVDAELPSPVAGTITEILVEADETVAVGIGAVPDCRRRRNPEWTGPAERRANRDEARGGRASHERRKRDPGGGADRERSRPRRGGDHRIRATRPCDQGRRSGRRRGQRSVSGRRPAHPRPRRNAREVHEREPLDPHGHELPHGAGGCARRQAQGAEGGRQEALVHAPDRLGDRAGRRRHAGDGPRVCRTGREATARDARQHEPRTGRGRGAQGRHALAGGARPARRERAQLQRFRCALRRARGGCARQHAPARRLPRREHHPHEPRRHRHRRERATPDARPGHDRRHRCDRLSARPDQGRSGSARRARRSEGHDDDLHLRPPGDPGCGVRRVPAPHRPALAGRGRLLRVGLRRRGRDPARRGPGHSGTGHGGGAGSCSHHARRGARRGPGTAPGGSGGHIAREGAADARPSRRAARPARFRPGRRPSARARNRGPERRADEPHPGVGPARGRARRDLRRRAPQAARDLHGHHRLRD